MQHVSLQQEQILHPPKVPPPLIFAQRVGDVGHVDAPEYKKVFILFLILQSNEMDYIFNIFQSSSKMVVECVFIYVLIVYKFLIYVSLFIFCHLRKCVQSIEAVQNKVVFA